MSSDKELEKLEAKVGQLEENIAFLKDLLTHIRKQFEEFKKEIKK